MLDVDADGGLRPVDAQFDLRDSRFSPVGSQEEPELAEAVFARPVARILGTRDVTGLSIQRADLLQRGVAEFHRLAADGSMPTVAKAQQAMALIERIDDPELTALAPQVTSALIDGTDTPDFEFSLSADLDAERLKARDLLFSGRAEQAIGTARSGARACRIAVRRGGRRAPVLQLVCGARGVQPPVRHAGGAHGAHPRTTCSTRIWNWPTSSPSSRAWRRRCRI